MERLSGGCHCANPRLEFETQLAFAQLQLRADQCSFCRKHAARTTSDPNGHVRIAASCPEEVLHCRFGQATADFLLCRRCGIYVAAVLTTESGRSYATLNVNCFDRSEEFAQAVVPVSYESESPTARVARRIARWTPAQLKI